MRNKSDNPYSVLLACFQNAGTLHTITLAQVRWFSTGAIRRVFIVSPYQLNIADHFGEKHFDLRGEWKKKLLKQFPKTDHFDSFKDYATRFSDIFGLKEKALSLFNQTVGIKVLGDLTLFMRQQMLEEPNAEEQFKNLYDQYTDLLLSHKAIQKDEQQLALLEPIVQKRAQLTTFYQQDEALKFIEEQLPAYFDNIETDLLGQEIEDIEEMQALLSAQHREIQIEIAGLHDEIKLLAGQKAALNIDGRIQLLQKDIISNKENRDRKRGVFDQYSQLAKNLGLPTELSEAVFYNNKKQATDIGSAIDVELENANYQYFTARNDLQKTTTAIEKTQETINAYLGRKGRIKPDLILIRKNLADLLDASEEELPFVGELLRVKDDSLFWENAIERVLRGFSLLLLVPEKFNKRVNQYVHAYDLKTRLTYQRIDPKDSSYVRWPSDLHSLVNKLETKESGMYTKWIEKQLVERYDYHCTDDLDVFYGSQKAITSNGLIRNANRHEKDDRPNNWNKVDYTLGWDNKDTVQLLIQEKRRLEKEHEALTISIQQVKQEIKQKQDKKNALTRIAEVQDFADINWPYHASAIQQFNIQIEELQNSSDQYKTIASQLAVVESNHISKTKVKEQYADQLSTVLTP